MDLGWHAGLRGCLTEQPAEKQLGLVAWAFNVPKALKTLAVMINGYDITQIKRGRTGKILTCCLQRLAHANMLSQSCKCLLTNKDLQLKEEALHDGPHIISLSIYAALKMIFSNYQTICTHSCNKTEMRCLFILCVPSISTDSITNK